MGNFVHKIAPSIEGFMGASDKVIDQVVSSNDVYNLVQPPTNIDVENRGILVEEAATAFNTGNYSALRDKIHETLQEYLYDDGKGKEVPLKDIVTKRYNERMKKSGSKSSSNIFSSLFSKNSSFEAQFDYVGEGARKCCWDLEKRGALGETALHVCLLNNSDIHNILAKEIIGVFPNTLHDVYHGDEYYGENVLHMAIANENMEMVEFVLKMGVQVGMNIQERCFGKFFSPQDQIDMRRDSDSSEEIKVDEATNYKGLVYWGEYPLSFAACSNQPAMFELLLKKGADIFAQDVNGNNVLHLMVIHDNQEMFDLCYNSAEDKKDVLLEATNKQSLTPLTLSAKLANKAMLDHILELKREIAWTFGDVTCSHYPLSDVDTINPDNGKINNKSALSIILSSESREHLSMLDGLLYQLLHEKWKEYAKIRFYERGFLFLLFLAVFVAAVYLQPAQPQVTINNVTTYVDFCYLQTISGAQQIARAILEILTLVGAIMYLVVAGVEVYNESLEIFVHTIVNAPMKGSFLVSCVLIICIIPCRYSCSVVAENVILTLAICTCIPYLLFFCRGFKLVGPFIIAIYKMVTGDLLKFLLIYSIFIMGFSQAMYVLFRGVEHPLFSYPFLSILGMFIITLGEFSDLYLDFDRIRNPNAAKLLFVVYMIAATVLLINVLIAMMGDTFYKIADTRWEWQRQWAKIVLIMEESVSPEHRIKKQRRYTQPLHEKNGRWFVVRNFREKKAE